MSKREIVVIGASAGGLEPLREIVAALPAGLGAAILVVVHLPPSSTSVLPTILGKSGPLSASHATDGAALAPGKVYVAPPDFHMLVDGRAIRLSRGPRMNNVRPAIDALFMTAARWAGPRVVGVVLSGLLDDGTAGARLIATAGGVTIAQDPAEAIYPAMPRNAIEGGGIMHVLPAREIAAKIIEALNEEVDGAMPTRGENEKDGPDEAGIESMLAFTPEEDAEPKAAASGFTCPDCHGALWEVTPEQVLRYRCRIGHSFAPESLFAAQSEGLEAALWAGYRALEESAALAKRLATKSAERGHDGIAARWTRKHVQAIDRARTLRSALEAGQLAAEDTRDDG